VSREAAVVKKIRKQRRAAKEILRTSAGMYIIVINVKAIM
jgi:hypothetical protein